MPKEFKSGLHKILKAIADDVELGETFTRKFDPNWFEDYEAELHDPLHSLFEQSKLNPKYAGHWQFLLLAVANEIYSKRTGRETFWDADREEKLFRAVLKHRKAAVKSGLKKSVEAICKELKTTQAYKTISSEGALQARFNIIIRKKRSLAKNKDAPLTLKRDLKWFSST